MLKNAQAGAICIGALGWSNPVWQETFYPAGLPAEWQLAYFNTQFGCVFLEETDWQQVTPEQRAQWYADTHERFVFLLESSALLPQPTELAGKVLPVCRDDPRILWFSRDSSLKTIASVLSGGQGNIPQFLVSQDGDCAQMERVATLLEVMGL